MAETKAERKKITVTQVKEVEKVGDKQLPKLVFKAKDEEGKQAWYFTFGISLFDVIKPEATIDADIEISKREHEGNIYIDRKVTQLYVDGQPVGGQKHRSYGKSLEMVQMEVDSKAKNTALMQACELAKVDKLEVNDILTKADEFYAWLKGTGIKGIVISKKEKPSEATMATIPTIEANSIQSIQQLYNWVASHGKKFTRTWVLENSSMTEAEIKADPARCAKDLVALKAWED